ncbi:BRCT domain-containing protein [Priestia megaterium]|uniref:BRCT domain-containing protein n=1 Tax=Priestia megaterium TaxID=1404 RepID=UPI00336B48C8
MHCKKTWPGLFSYKLSVVAEYLNITFNHHHALEDAKTAGEIFSTAIKTLEVSNIDELISILKITSGTIFKGGYVPTSLNNSKRININELIPSTNEFDFCHPFYNATFAFTGTLQSLSRKEAMQKVIDLGAICGNGVTKKTNYLVLGDQDFSRFADGKKSSKLKKAEDLIEKGQDLEIISEVDFLALI